MISYSNNPSLTVKRADKNTIECVIENPTGFNIYMGQEYRLFIVENEDMREIDLSDVPMTLELFGMETGDTLDFVANLPFDLEPGTYMIAKPVSVGGEQEAVIAGSFVLK